MASREQRKKERHAKKRLEKKKKLEQSRGRQQGAVEVALVSHARHRQRLIQQVPAAWQGETPEDVAVFDDAALSALPSEMAQQVHAVRESIQDACALRGDDALKRTAVIPRNSPLSEWRLFIRGFVSWMANDIEGANEVWKRLNAERRPGRIAASMMIALRSDLENISRPRPVSEPVDTLTSDWVPADDLLLYHAKLLRRFRIERAAIRIARAGMNVPDEASELLLGKKKIQWLQQFVAEYKDTEPDLTAALSQAALSRAYAQSYGDMFNLAASAFQGPAHDRQNRLLTFFYFRRFEDDSRAERNADQSLQLYLKVDLPQNENLSPVLRGAIAGQIYLNEAGGLVRPGGNAKAIRELLNASAKAYPANRVTYEVHTAWLQGEIGNDRLTAAKRKVFEDELAAVMTKWSAGLPNDVEPRLWLVDHLLENERTEEARPHVDFLAASRQDDPRVRATPWKWQLLEAMRLCRRKAWLAEVPARLDDADRLWPAWLSREWLPYLRAAWTLRSGLADAFEEQRQQICQEAGRTRDSLTDACMMLGAAQRMRVAGEDLKRLRSAVERCVGQLELLPLHDLIEAGAFFWDLQRVQLVYPAYRMHGGKIGPVLLRRLGKLSSKGPDTADNDRIQRAILWTSQHRFWKGSYEQILPACFADSAVRRHPYFAAAELNAFLKGRYHWGADRYRELGAAVRESARSNRDPYYRYWFESLADELEDRISQDKSRSFGLPFDILFGNNSEDDDDDDETPWEQDDECECPSCQAARRANAQASL